MPDSICISKYDVFVKSQKADGFVKSAIGKAHKF